MLTNEQLAAMAYEYAMEQIEELAEYDPDLAYELELWLIEYGTLDGFTPECVEVE